MSSGITMTKRVLVAYATKFGATAEIAEVIGSTLAESGLPVDVRRARDVDTLDPYDVVVLGSAVYMARWRRDALRLLRRPELAERAVWLFSSGPAGQDTAENHSDRWTKPQRVMHRAAEIDARGHVVFGGRVSEDAGGFVRRNMARNSPPELRDRRNWDEIRAWAAKIAKAST
jgi:menaquinone-dependent protoporphyrinogen oxidase